MSRFREIVKKELASYGYSLDEDAKKDNEYLRHSIDKFDEYIAKLTKQIDPDKRYFDSDMNLAVHLVEEFGDVAVVITFEDKVHANANGTYNRNGVIQIILGHIFDLDNEADITRSEDPITREDNKISMRGDDILRLMNSNAVRSTFVHEYQHFIDDKQRNYLAKSSSKLKSTMQNLPADERAEKYKDFYYNSAHENNAHYMTLLHDISVELRKQADVNLALLTPEQRMDLFLYNISRQDSDFKALYNKLDKKLQRHLINRLYKYFSADFWNDRRKEIEDQEMDKAISELFGEN